MSPVVGVDVVAVAEGGEVDEFALRVFEGEVVDHLGGWGSDAGGVGA